MVNLLKKYPAYTGHCEVFSFFQLPPIYQYILSPSLLLSILQSTFIFTAQHLGLMLEPDKPNFILLGKVATNNFTSLLFFRYIFGPTPLFLCNFNLFLKRTLTAQFMMFMDAIMISRFMFIFVLRNPSAFQDDFWSLFGNIWILSFCCIGQIVSELMLGCENLNTNICSGKYIYISSDCLKVTRNDRFNGSIALFTLIVHVFVNIKIQIFKWKRPADQHQISQRTKLSWRNFRESKFFSNVIMTTINSILALLLFCLLSLKN